MTDEILISLIVSLDIYLAAAAYSNNDIKIPYLSALVISSVCASILGISLKFAGLICQFLPVGICETAGMILLTSIGVITVFKSFIRSLIKRLSEKGILSLKMGSLGLGISIYLDDTAADTDHSKTLSLRESVTLALASSFDCAATGINGGFSGISPLKSSIFTLFIGLAAILLGGLTGKKISSLRHDFSWVGGVLLIIFAVACYIS